MNGVDKAQIVLDRRPLIERLAGDLQRLFAEVLIVSDGTRRYDCPRVKLVADDRPDCGPLMGLYSGLQASKHEVNFVMACDMPYVNDVLITRMISCAGDCDVVVPVVNGYYEPLLAVYCKSTAPAIKACLDAGRLKVTSFYDQVRLHRFDQAQVTAADPELGSFFNINTPADLVEAQRRFDSQLSDEQDY